MIRRVTTVALSGVLAFGIAGCSSDAKKSADPTTTAGNGSTTSTVAAVTTTTTAEVNTTTTAEASTTTTAPDTTDTTDPPPVDNETFAQIIDEVQSTLDNATTACNVRLVFDTNRSMPKPANAAQGKLAIEFLVPMYTAMADSAPPGEAKNAAILRVFATRIQEFAQSVNYDPASLDSANSPFEDESFAEPLFAFITATDECPGATKVSL